MAVDMSKVPPPDVNSMPDPDAIEVALDKNLLVERLVLEDTIVQQFVRLMVSFDRRNLG